MKILITGSTGYIGGRLIEYLSKNSPHELHAISRTIPEKMKQMFPNVLFYQIDMLKPDCLLTELCHKVDCIIHLAAANEVQSKNDPVLACDINVTASVRLFEIAKKSKVKRFIYLSTAHVYGSPLVGTLNERTPCYPIHPYAITHKVVEDFVLASHKEKKIEGVVLRLSNTFGAPLLPSVNRWTLLLNDLARNAVQKCKIELKSTGKQYRDFITLSRVCAAIQFFIEIPAMELHDGLFNLGGDNSMRIRDMAQLLSQRCEYVLGYRPEISILIDENGKVESDSHLNYEIKKLTDLAFPAKQDVIGELDKLLLFCIESFREINNEII